MEIHKFCFFCKNFTNSFSNYRLSLSINSTCIAILNPSVPTFSPFPGQFFFREQPGDNHVEGAEKRYILIRVNSPDHVAILTSALYYNSSFCEIKSEEIREMIGSLAPETSSTHGAAASYMKTGGEFVGGAFRLSMFREFFRFIVSFSRKWHRRRNKIVRSFPQRFCQILHPIF